jgi:hypothetical protein
MLCCSTERNDHESPLLRLPSKIRNRIYEYVLTQGTFTFTVKRIPRIRRGPFIPDLDLGELPTKPLPDLALASTCRWIHDEAALFALSLNTIHCTSIYALSLNTIHCTSIYALSWLPHYLNIRQRHSIRDIFFTITSSSTNELSRELSTAGLEATSLGNMLPGVQSITLEIGGYFATRGGRGKRIHGSREFSDIFIRLFQGNGDAHVQIKWGAPLLTLRELMEME